MKAGFLKYPLLLLSLTFIAYGVFKGEMMVVLMKAASICLECIGIG